MKVKDLKEQLASMPDDADVMMYVNRMLPVSVVRAGTIEDLKPTGKKLFGVEVIGGEKRPIAIFFSESTGQEENYNEEVCTTPYDFENPLKYIG